MNSPPTECINYALSSFKHRGQLLAIALFPHKEDVMSCMTYLVNIIANCDGKGNDFILFFHS